MPTVSSTRRFYRETYKHLEDKLVVRLSREFDKSGKSVYDMYCPLCNCYRGKLRICARLLPCKSCGQKRKKSSLKGKKRNEEFNKKISEANYRVRKAKNPQYQPQSVEEKRILHSLRTRMWQALRGISRDRRTLDLTGCSSQALKLYLESKFKPGMSWNNYGRSGWHVDHIKPLSRFNLTDVNQQRQACHYTNLQPLWAEENVRKSDSI